MPEPPPISDFLTPTTIHTTELCCFERTRGRGSLQRIDSALQPYLLHRATMPVTERIAALARIISECRRWLNDKGTEAKSTTVTRKPHVETLLRETTLWYKYYRYETNKTLTEIVGVNAHAVGAKVKYSVEPTKALFGGYQHETSRAKGQPRPAAGIVKPYVAQAVTAGAIVNTSLHTLTAAEYAIVEQMAEIDPGNATPTMAYLNKLSRIGEMVIVENGKLMSDPATPFKTSGPFAYAIDRYGNMYAKRNRDGLFHHSSFCRGQEVICAGCLMVSDGVLRHIDNASGHYCPSRANLHNAVQLLHVYGLDISQAQALVVEAAPHGAVCSNHGAACHRPLVRASTYSHVEDFRLNPNAVADRVEDACSA
jgi:hypothetical protein